MMRLLIGVGVLVLFTSACGGTGNGTGLPPSPPPPAANPCTTAGLEAEEQAPAAVPDPDPARAIKRVSPDGGSRWRALDALWAHRQAESRQPLAPPSRELARPSADAGDIALIADEGELVLPPNTFDLQDVGLRFTPNASGGYDVRRLDTAFRPDLGARLELSDDDSADRAVPFAFPFYGRSEARAFVNSDGNVTFEEPDRASTERNVARLLTGPPRVSAFLADLDPAAGAGRVFLNAAPDRFTVTWCNVRGFESQKTTTVQTTLLPGGAVEMVYAPAITLGNAIVGLSPGPTGDFRPLNLSDPGPTGGGAAAVGERFALSAQLDLVALSRKFYQAHPDSYDQLVFWTDAPLVTDAFAYEATVKNEVRGIGVDVYDLAGDFGSAGRLRSLVVMDWLGKYPDDPAQKFLGENTTVSLIGQETGHRWLAQLLFRDRNGVSSDEILGRQLAHWSFFLNSEASVMEGNDIEDLGGGSFRTAAAVRRYSQLDQYAMGLVPEAAVRPFFYVESPINLASARTRESAPEAGVTFNGTRRDVLIQDVVAVNGRRDPPAAEAAKVHRQAFAYMTGQGKAADPVQIGKLDRIRRAWEGFFLQATDGRMPAITVLH